MLAFEHWQAGRQIKPGTVRTDDMPKKDLVQIIRDNPGCIAVIDNDCWWLYRDEDHRDSGDDPLAEDGAVKQLGDGGYGSGNCYGGDILQALAVIVGIKIESV